MLASLKEDYFVFVKGEYCLKGERTGKVYYLGDRVKVRVDRVDMERVRIDLSLVSDESKPKKPAKKKTKTKNEKIKNAKSKKSGKKRKK